MWSLYPWRTDMSLNNLLWLTLLCKRGWIKWSPDVIFQPQLLRDSTKIYRVYCHVRHNELVLSFLTRKSYWNGYSDNALIADVLKILQRIFIIKLSAICCAISAVVMLVISVTCLPVTVTMQFCKKKNNLINKRKLPAWRRYHLDQSFREQLPPFSIIPLKINASSSFHLLFATANIFFTASSQICDNCTQFMLTFEHSCFCSRLEDITCSKLTSLSMYIKSEKENPNSSDNPYLSYAIIDYFSYVLLEQSGSHLQTYSEVLHNLGKSSA